jgi:hypothetical protein
MGADSPAENYPNASNNFSPKCIDYCTKIETKVSSKILLVESSKNIKFFAAQIQIPLLDLFK